MIKYAKVINENGRCEVGDGTNINFYQSIGMQQLDVQQSDVDNCWYLADKCPMKSDEEKEQEEKERIANLKLTKRVFALMLQELGITYAMLKELIATNEQAQLEWDLSVQLERGNPLIDIFGEQLGVTKEQIDILFKVANGEATVEDLQKTIKTIAPEENLNNEVI